jgi:hypothetical protein
MQSVESVESVEAVYLAPLTVGPKKPYNKEVIDAIQAKIDDRTKFLLQTSPDVSMKIDTVLSKLYFELNSYNLNPAQTQTQAQAQTQTETLDQQP